MKTLSDRALVIYGCYNVPVMNVRAATPLDDLFKLNHRDFSLYYLTHNKLANIKAEVTNSHYRASASGLFLVDSTLINGYKKKSKIGLPITYPSLYIITVEIENCPQKNEIIFSKTSNDADIPPFPNRVKHDLKRICK